MIITKKLNTIFTIVIFTGLGMFSYLLLLNYSNLSPQVADAISSIEAMLFFIIAFNIGGYSTIKLSSWINNKYMLDSKNGWKKIWVYLSVMTILFILNYGFLVLAKILAGVSQPLIFPNGGIRILIVVWLVELVILGLMLANSSIQDALKFQRQATLLQRENNEARYIALQNQLNPHFLFNSLNTLIAEIEFNPKNAVAFTKKLSNVYRYVLQCQNKPLVTLEEELEFLNAYLFLHSVRLGDCITCNKNIPADYMDYNMPPLTLQLLVENIIKHNTITQSKPMVINIDVDTKTNYLVITNTKNLKNVQETSGLGLKNLSARNNLIGGKDIIVIADTELFTVKTPLLYE